MNRKERRNGVRLAGVGKATKGDETRVKEPT